MNHVFRNKPPCFFASLWQTVLAMILLAFGMNGLANAGLNDGLVAYWSFDDCTAKDNSRNGHDGTISGNVECVNGVNNTKSMNFHADDDRINAIADASFSSKTITLSTWINPTGAGDNNPRILGIGPNGTSGQFYSLILGGTSNNRQIQLYCYGGFLFSSNQRVADNSGWHHVVTTIDGTLAKIYIDGKLDAQINNYSSLPLFDGSLVQIGYSDNSFDDFVGGIDEARIYNRALTAAEVSALYKQGNQAPDPNDILGGFLDLNNSYFDYANNQIKLKFTVPPEQLGNYFNKDIWFYNNVSSINLAEVQAELQKNNPITLIFNDYSFSTHADTLFSLRFRSGKGKTVATFQGVLDKVRYTSGKAVLNSRTVAETKPTKAKVCANQQGIKSVCNNFFNSMETGTNNFNTAVDRNTLTHRLVDFDKIFPEAAITPAWAESKYGKAPQNDNGRIPLLLIHGWQGGIGLRNPAQLVLSDNSELQYWRHFLDYYLATPELQNKYHLYLYHYTTYKHITYNANLLTTLLNELADKQPSSDLNVAMQSGDKGVVVLAHSMGGLVTRSAVEEYGAFGDNAEKLRRLITLDTPHHGSPAADPSFIKLLYPISKDVYTQGAADIQWDNFDQLYSLDEVYDLKSPRWESVINSQTFDAVYQAAFKNAYQAAYHIDCQDQVTCPDTQNPWLAWLNTNFIPSVNTYKSKYLLYAGWMIGVPSNQEEVVDIISNGDMQFSDLLLHSITKQESTGGIASGGAEPVHSALWYILSPFDTTTPFELSGDINETPFYDYFCNKKSGWDASQWFGGDASTIKRGFKTCGNAILISKSDTLSSPNPNHPLGFQLRIFWDYDHEKMVNGAYSGKTGVWDKYIGKHPYITNGNTLSNSGFVQGTTDTWTLRQVRDIYIGQAIGYRRNMESLVFNEDNKGNPAEYNPLTLEPLFNVLQGDLMREADSK